MMTSNEEDDSEFSPQDAFNMFNTPVHWSESPDRLNVPVPPQIFDQRDTDVTLDTSLLAGVTLAGVDTPEGGGPPDDLLNPPRVEDSPIDPAGWIFGETTDTVVVPLVLSVIGVFAVVSNLVVIAALLGLRRMRSGPNLLLVNLAVADLVVITTAVPTAVVSRVGLLGATAVSPLACRFVHYTIFVGVYVSMYTLVVVCVFGFFGELLRRGTNRMKCTGWTGDTVAVGGRAPTPLSVCSAVVSCVVIWAAFGVSHLTFVMQSDVTALAAFEEPLICEYGASGSSESGESSRTRTLWITFLACAFLLPLTIVCALSAAVLKFQRRHQCREVTTATGCREVETAQNSDNDGKGRRELTVLVMASTVVRTVCWLPLQIFVLTDVFGADPGTQTSGTEMAASDTDSTYRRKWELFCVCAALTGSGLLLPLLRVVSSECRDSFRLVLGRRCHGSGETENHRNLGAVRRLQMEPGSPCSSSLAAAMVHHQRSYHRDNEFDVRRPKHLSLPPDDRLSVTDVNETILSIISDSSNHINYT